MDARRGSGTCQFCLALAPSMAVVTKLNPANDSALRQRGAEEGGAQGPARPGRTSRRTGGPGRKLLGERIGCPPCAGIRSRRDDCRPWTGGHAEWGAPGHKGWGGGWPAARLCPTADENRALDCADVHVKARPPSQRAGREPMKELDQFSSASPGAFCHTPLQGFAGSSTHNRARCEGDHCKCCLSVSRPAICHDRWHCWSRFRFNVPVVSKQRTNVHSVQRR